MARYVEPLVSHLKSFLSHRKFLHGGKEEVDAAAKKEKARRPSTFPYFLSVNLEHMGMLTLTYVTNQNPHHEYIVVTHKGFTYRRKNFSNPDKLIAYFKRHYKEVRTTQQTTSIQHHAVAWQLTFATPPSSSLWACESAAAGRRGKLWRVTCVLLCACVCVCVCVCVS